MLNLKYIIDMEVKCKIVKSLDYSREENLSDLGFNNEFLDTT